MSNFGFAKLKPKEAIEFLKKKGYAFGFDYRDIEKEEHAIAFTVAKASSIDVLSDIKGELEKALEKGETFENFKKNLKPKLVEKGWWGKAKQEDPLTGITKEVLLGSNNRLKTIFYTNMDMAYAAGNWQKIEQTKATHPYLQYKNNDPSKSRPEHRKWHNLVLPVDDEWWDTHYPPNGWNCKCWVKQISKHEVGSGKVKVNQRPQDEMVTYKNSRTGAVVQVPKGVNPSFDYNVGKAREKAYTPPPLGGLPKTVQSLKQLPPLSRASTIPNNAILPKNLSNEDYMKAFLGEFGADIGKNTFFTDKTGEVIPINENLFKSGSGFIKVNKNDRGQFMKLLAQGIIEPDEIWMQWVKNDNNSWTLKRRYIKVWEAEEGSHCLSVFDKTKDGWQGTTTFTPKHDKTIKARDNYINQYRDGLLLYKQ